MKKLTASKAKTILSDKSVKGHPLTDKQKKFFGAIAGGAKPISQRKSITLPKKELVEEHKELVQTLKHGSKAKLKQEAKEQSKELTEYKSMRTKKRGMVSDAVSAYKSAGKGLENVGANIRQNLIAGQKNPNASNASTVINPLKGSMAAFKAAFPKKRATSKLERGMRGYKK